ncbi:MAG: OsmC family protein [Chloroflexi bacterium]|nr:OsmC family protein [Chloroflexota bacterium]
MSNVAVKWAGQNSQMFMGRDSFGHVLMTGSWPDDENQEWQEWKAMKPSDLLLVSLASCSAYDVVMILKRQRQKLTNLYVNVEGTNASEPPYQFIEIHQHYVIEGDELDPKKVARAIKLSEEKYCSVAATVRGVAELSHSFEII